ncbi:Protein mono-ADP-ribosyltransferase parp4 [Boothiomyces macroporosus]|uniref:Protein mono-ADP-ribosyltransferase parp4 n=1 Tax=Boothiomyces macroporosus TaxID=261099 RepID=A0AAD5UDJ7_9FUNG|nr:Protein mono-ADP-ribosyltransferase parp4 [Boothiomyces macroporosus]
MAECRYGANCRRINMDHLKELKHPISVYMSRTAVVHDDQKDEFNCIPHCKDKDSCQNSNPKHLKNYWHPGDECVDVGEVLENAAEQMRGKQLQTTQPPMCMDDLKISLNDNNTGVNDAASFKSLKEISMAKVAKSINENPLDYVEYFQNMSEEIAKTYFKLLTFHALEQLAAANAFEWWSSNDSLVDYCMAQENKYREMFVNDRDNEELKDPYLMMSSVFVGYETKHLPESQSDTLLLATDFEEGPAFASRELFRKQWYHITGGVFENVDLSNLFFAGGAVLAALQPFDSTKDINEQMIERGYYNSDIDIFVHGIEDTVVATERIKKFCEDIQTKTGNNLLFVRNRNSLTIVREFPLRQIQVIFRLYHSPSEVLLGFDIDCCCVGYDGKEVYGIPRFFGAITYQRNLVDVTRRSPSYEYRLYKYSKRGFGVLIRGKKIELPTINEEDEGSLSGLPRLASLSKGWSKKLYPRYEEDEDEQSEAEISDNSDLQKKRKISNMKKSPITFDDFVKLAQGDLNVINYKIGRGSLLPDMRTTEIIDIDRYTEVNSFKYSNYMTIKIPYSANWTLSRIKNFVQYLNQAFSMNHNYGSFMDMEFTTILSGGDEDFYDIPNCVEIVDSADKVLQEDLGCVVVENDKELLSKYSPDECWLVDNPGQQMLTGSFQPIFSDMESWISGSA